MDGGFGRDVELEASPRVATCNARLDSENSLRNGRTLEIGSGHAFSMSSTCVSLSNLVASRAVG